MKKSSKTKDNAHSNVAKGEVYWFDPIKETKVDISPLVVILSGEIHNKNSSFVIFSIAGTKSLETVRKFFEVAGEVEGKKIKAMVSAIHMFNKEVFLQKAKYLGELRKEVIKEINEKIKLILELDN